MANQRLELINKVVDIQYSSSSPLLLEAAALYLDKTTNSCIAQLKWKNIDSRPVNAVMIELDGYDTFDQKIEPVNYQYDGLLAVQGSEFGDKTPIIIRNNKVVRFEVIIQAVSFSDKSVWRSDSPHPLEILPASKPQSIKGELLEQLERDLSQKGIKSTASYDTQSAMGLWQCGCGSWQYDGNPCLKCKTTQQDLASFSDPIILEKHLLEYKEEQEQLRIKKEQAEEEARIAREKEEEERRLQEEEERRIEEELRKEEEALNLELKKTKKKVIIVTASIMALIAIVGCAIMYYFIPKGNYEKAEKLLQNGDYKGAYSSFAAAGNFQDAKERAKQAAYEQGVILKDQGSFESAYAYFSRAEGYKDAQELKNQAAVLQAEKMFDQFDYDKAAEWYTTAGDTEKARVVEYQKSALQGDITWNSFDTQKDAHQLPDGIFVFSTGETSKEKRYGVIKTGKNGWVTQRSNYTWVEYNRKHSLILAGTGSSCTIIDLRNDTLADIPSAESIAGVSDDGIVRYTVSTGKYSHNYGFCLRNGTIIAQPEYDRAYDFSEGLAAVRKDQLWGFINTTGKTVIDFKYTDVESFSNGYAKVEMDAHKVKKGDMYVSYDKGWGLVDKMGKHVIEPNWYEIDYSDKYLSKGVVLVAKGYKRKQGLQDLNDNTILEPIYSTIGEERDGLRYVRILKDGESYYPCTTAGWIDSSGRMVINLISLGIDGPREDDPVFINGCAVLSYWRPGSWSRDICDLIINRQGQILWKGDDEWDATQRSNGDIELRRMYKEKKEYKHEYKYFRTENGALIETTKDETSFGNKNTGKSNSTSVGQVDLSSAFYKQWSSVSSFSSEGIALVSLNANGPYGYVTNQSSVLVDPIYVAATEYKNGYAAVELNDKWGILDRYGKYAIEPQFVSISEVSTAGTVFVEYENGTYALLNTTGVVIVSDITAVQSTTGQAKGMLPTPGRDVLVKTSESDDWQLLNEKGERTF